MNTYIASFAWLCLFALAPACADDTSFAKWEKEIVAIEAKIESGASPQECVLFVGSSSVRKWNLKESFPDLLTSNHGFGGSQMADSVHFFDRIVAPVKPSMIVVYAGDNDIAQKKTPQMVADDFAQFAARVQKQLPECRKVIYVAIKPSVRRWALADTIKATNELIKSHCETHPRLEFLDIWPLMLDASGQPRPELLLEDGLHMSKDGYQIWSTALEPLLK
jgi:lysophospholipase L1-like esterase